MKQLAQGVGYSKLPIRNAHAIYVTLAARDFFNASSFAISPNAIPLPDAFVIDKPSSSGGAAANETGYLGAQASIDVSQNMRLQGMTGLSTVYIDNSMGAGTCQLRHKATGHSVTAPPFTQGYYPLLLPEGNEFSFDVTYVDSRSDNLVTLPSFGTYPDSSADISGAGGVFYNYNVESGFLKFCFTDILMPAAQWNTRNLMTGIWYDFPTTIAASNTFQVALNRNVFRKGFLIGNYITAAEPLFVSLHQDNETDALTSSIGLAAGQYIMDKSLPAYIGQITIAAATIGHVAVVKEFQ